MIQTFVVIFFCLGTESYNIYYVNNDRIMVRYRDLSYCPRILSRIVPEYYRTHFFDLSYA